MKRFALMYTRPGSYTRACLAALRSKYDVDVFAVEYPLSEKAPYTVSPLSGVAELACKTEFQDAAQLADRILKFGPDAVYISGWADKLYLAAAKIIRKSGVPVISGLDAQYKGTLRQQVATKLVPYLLKPSIDVMWAAGERQRYFAQRLGYRGMHCWEGLLCCDWAHFSLLSDTPSKRRPQFLFVGRYVEAKGLDVLVEAYRCYRSAVDDPWDLVCAGTGPQGWLFDDQPGVRDLGFVQPDEIPSLFHESSAIVLPSRHEPWGVVVQEAAAARLPLLCSDRVGAAVHLVRNFYNGFVTPADNAKALAFSMLSLSKATPAARAEMGERSFQLGQQYLPERWADTLIDGVARLRGGWEQVTGSRCSVSARKATGNGFGN